jgi:hypothetical protein
VAFQPIPNTAKILLQGSIEGQLCENVFYAQQGAPYDSSSLATLADAVASWMTDPTTLGNYGTGFRFTGVKVISMEDDTGLQVEVPVLGAFGTAAGRQVPNNVAVAIHKIGTVGGRHGKGRVYHPAITDTFMADVNTLTTASAEALCDLYRGLRDVVAAIPGAATVLGYAELVNAGVPLAIGVFIQILDFACRDLTVDSQRRRLPGRGA